MDHRRFKLTEEAMQAFTRLKKEIMNSTQINGPLIGQSYIAFSDASNQCCSFILYQKNKESQPDEIPEGKEDEYRFLGAHSRTLNKQEKAYPIFKQEESKHKY